MNMRTPLKNVHSLGSAKEGADHFWKQRVSAVANVFLGIWLVWLVASLAGSDHASFKQALGHPFVAIGLLPAVAHRVFASLTGRPATLQLFLAIAGGGLVLSLSGWVLWSSRHVRRSQRRMSDPMYRAKLVEFGMASAATDSAAS